MACIPLFLISPSCLSPDSLLYGVSLFETSFLTPIFSKLSLTDKIREITPPSMLPIQRKRDGCVKKDPVIMGKKLFYHSRNLTSMNWYWHLYLLLTLISFLASLL